MIDFIIIGAQKAGTTSAVHNLNLHPMIRVFNGVTEYGQREIEFFNQHWERGRSWYFSHFPFTTHVQGEKTAELFHRTICHSRIYETAPKAKLILLLRCPVRRAFSQWKMATFSKNDETRSFEATIESERRALEEPGYRDRFYSLAQSQLSCWREGYLLKGFYYEQLVHLYQVFPRSQICLGISERVRGHKVREYNRFFNFLGVAEFDGPFGEHFVATSHAELSRRARIILSELYRPYNELLFNLIGESVPEWF